MRHGIRDLPPSRRDKKQIVAHLDAELVEAVHIRRRARSLTIQEIVAEAINEAVKHYGRTPFMAVVRDRLVRRNKALAKVQDASGVPGSRTGKRRIAAWFDRTSVERVAAFAREVGTKIEGLVELGLRRMITQEELERAAEGMREASEAVQQQEAA